MLTTDQPQLGTSFDVHCGSCGGQVHVDGPSLLRRPIEVPGLKGVKEIGVECAGCGKLWRMGFTSGELERTADKIIRARYEPVRQAALRAQYIREQRRLQVEVLVRTRGAGRRI